MGVEASEQEEPAEGAWATQGEGAEDKATPWGEDAMPGAPVVGFAEGKTNNANRG